MWGKQREDIAIVLLLQGSGSRNLKKVINISSVTGASSRRDAAETKQYIVFMCSVVQAEREFAYRVHVNGGGALAHCVHCRNTVCTAATLCALQQHRTL
jgi:ribosomal protein S9